MKRWNLFKRSFWTDCIFGTLFIFGLMWAIFNVSQLAIFDAFDPIGEALSDFESSDIAFSQIRDPNDVHANEDIVIVNISKPYLVNRARLAQMINIINQHNPKVIGIDMFFWSLSSDTLGDLALAEAYSKVKNLVMVTKFQEDIETEENTWEIISHPSFISNATLGFANLNTEAAKQDDFKVCRSFPPKRVVEGEEAIAFAVQIANQVDPEKTKRFLERDNEWETINYKGNIIDVHKATDFGGKFGFLDWDDVMEENFEPDMIKDKIIIFGETGENMFDTSWDDKFFTPLNRSYAGKTNPDMYGVVIHANIVGMILDEDPINELGEFWDALIGILICFANVVAFSWVYRKLPRWYDGITKLIQLVELMVLFFIIIYLFAEFSFKVNLTFGLAAVALAGDGLEVFYGVVMNLFNKERRRQLFTIRNEEV
jgi:CHASE2 domain-containing sensor protein